MKISCPNETNAFPTNTVTLTFRFHSNGFLENNTAYKNFIHLGGRWPFLSPNMPVLVVIVIVRENQIDPLKVSPVDKGHYEGWMPKSSRQGQPNAVSRSNVLGDPFIFLGSYLHVNNLTQYNNRSC